MQVHQIVAYVIDFDKLGAAGIRSTLEQTRFPNDCLHINVRSIETRDIGPWDDDHPLNKKPTAEAELQRIFGNESAEDCSCQPQQLELEF